MNGSLKLVRISPKTNSLKRTVFFPNGNKFLINTIINPFLKLKYITWNGRSNITTMIVFIITGNNVYSAPNNPNLRANFIIKNKSIHTAANPKAFWNTTAGLILFLMSNSNMYL